MSANTGSLGEREVAERTLLRLSRVMEIGSGGANFVRNRTTEGGAKAGAGGGIRWRREGGRRDRIALIVEPRRQEQLFDVLWNGYWMLGRDWDLRIMCGTGNRGWIEEWLRVRGLLAGVGPCGRGGDGGGCVGFELVEMEGVENLKIEDQNRLFRGWNLYQELWDEGYRKLLVWQTDVLLLEPPPLDVVERVRFIGAPWQDTQGVGGQGYNGGQSVRDIGWCLRVLRGDPLGARLDRRRAETGEEGWPLAVVNEDVFWSSAAKLEDDWVDRGEAGKWAMEITGGALTECIPVDGPSGIHGWNKKGQMTGGRMLGFVERSSLGVWLDLTYAVMEGNLPDLDVILWRVFPHWGWAGGEGEQGGGIQ